MKRWLAAVLAISAVVSVDCGKKGPPLPPLVKLPAPPADLAAARRGSTVRLSFTVPAVNTDGTRPANVESAAVYAITVAPTVTPLSDANLLKYGTKVGTVAVKAPRDPNQTADADDPSDEVDPPEGAGLDQGARAALQESLTDEMLENVTVPLDKNLPKPPEVATGGPLLGPPPSLPVRTYAAFGSSTRGRKGPLSRRVTVPLVPPPPAPSRATVAYDETAVTVTWPPVGGATAAGPDELLPSHPIGVAPRPAIVYNVYDTSGDGAPLKLTAKPIDDAKYADTRMTWGEKRCYIVVAAETIEDATIESEPSPAKCETLVDTFAPAAPKELKAISSEGTINLIWDPNAEKDLAGYLIFRGVEPAETLTQMTATPVVEPSFRDTVQAGVAFVYAVKAVDRAGNQSGFSPRVVETAR